MSKLAPENKFLDLSDYGRFIAKPFAKSLINTPFTPIHITLLFFIVGLLAIYCMLQHYFIWSFGLLILKSIIDAADGELARLRKKPSYIGRYLDSNLDLVLNFGFLYTIHYLTNSHFMLMLLAFFAMQMQGTVYNYYYLILRTNLVGSDTTSRINENTSPKALHGENQQMVNFLFFMYSVFYRGFDQLIIRIDGKAKYIKQFPHWFMTFVSIYGLGFQLLIIGVFLVLHLIDFIIPFFIMYSVFIIIIILIRKLFLK